MDGLGGIDQTRNGIGSDSEAEDLAEIDEIMEGLMANAGNEDEEEGEGE